MAHGDHICPKCHQYTATHRDDFGIHHCPATNVSNEVKEVPLLAGVPTELISESISLEELQQETEKKTRQVLTQVLSMWIKADDDATMIVHAIIEEIIEAMRNEGLV